MFRCEKQVVSQFCIPPKVTHLSVGHPNGSNPTPAIFKIKAMSMYRWISIMNISTLVNFLISR